MTRIASRSVAASGGRRFSRRSGADRSLVDGAAPLELGFLGGSLGSAIGPAHFAAARLDGRFDIVSGCFSRDRAMLGETAKRWQIDPGRCDTDWRRYLEREHRRLDAVAILTPIPAHHPMLLAALELGLPIISEKALVGGVAEADDLISRCEERRHFLATTLNYSGYPVVRLLRRLVREGRFGRVQQVHLEMPLENYLRRPIGSTEPASPQTWRLVDGPIPTLLLDLGVHLDHLLRYVTGAHASAVMADINRFSAFEGIVDDARLWVRTEEGLNASLWMSKVALGHRNGLRLRLFGDEGSAEWFQAEPETLRVTDVNGVRSEIDRGVENEVLGTEHYNRFKAGHPAGYVEAFANLYHDIGDALLDYHAGGTGEHAEVFGAAHSRAGLALLEAAVEASEVGHWVEVPPVPDTLRRAA